MAQAAKVALDARRSEDGDRLEEKDAKSNKTYVKFEDMGDMAFDLDTDLGREMLKLQQKLKREGANPDKEYGAGGKAPTD